MGQILCWELVIKDVGDTLPLMSDCSWNSSKHIMMLSVKAGTGASEKRANKSLEVDLPSALVKSRVWPCLYFLDSVLSSLNGYLSVL